MAIFASAQFNGPGREKPEYCATRVATIQEALRKLGLSVTDPPEFFDKSTSDAVCKCNGLLRNILKPGQRAYDRFEGKRTVTRLDREVAALEEKKTAPITLGSTNWRILFFGNKGFSGNGIH